MLSPELLKLKEQLESGEEEITVNTEKLLAELNKLNSVKMNLQESLSLSSKVCPTCGGRV